MAEQDTGTFIGSIDKPNGERIYVHTCTFKNVPLVDIRTFFRGEDGEFRPGKAGLRFRSSLVPELIEILQGVESEEEA